MHCRSEDFLISNIKERLKDFFFFATSLLFKRVPSEVQDRASTTSYDLESCGSKTVSGLIFIVIPKLVSTFTELLLFKIAEINQIELVKNETKKHLVHKK